MTAARVAGAGLGTGVFVAAICVGAVYLYGWRIDRDRNVIIAADWTRA